MTSIRQIDQDITTIIKTQHVYGAEVIIKRLVTACKDEPYLQKEHIIHLLDEAYKELDKYAKQ